MNNDTITIKKEFAQAILNYLQTRPYAEVFQLIDTLIASARDVSASANERVSVAESVPEPPA